MKAWFRVTSVVQTLVLSLFILSPAFAQSRGPVFKVPPPGVLQFPTAIPNAQYSFDLKTLLSSQGEPPLKWEISGAPFWLKLDSANSRVTGLPTAADAGTAKFKISVQDKNNEGGELDRDVTLLVFAPPTFNTDKIDLGIQNEDSPWTFDLKPYVQNPSGGTITFDSANLRPWMSLDKATGILTGTPRRAHVGKYTGITFVVKGTGGESTAQAFGEVKLVIKPPKWLKKDIVIENAKEDAPYSRNLVEFVVNTDPLITDIKYEIISATPPPWLQIGTSSGNLFGTPKAANVGAVSVVVRLSAIYNGVTYDDTSTFKFEVQHVNHPPEWLAKPLNLPNGASGVAYSQDLSKSARDVDPGDVLTYTIISYNGPGAAWATLDPKTGKLSGTPKKENVGDNSFLVQVADQGGLTDQTTVQFKVIKSNEPPYWLANPTILPTAQEDKSYGVDLNNYAKDPDGDKLTFTLLDSVSWLTVNPNGVVSGTPAKKDLGLHKFTVRVSDGIAGSAVAEIQVFVEHTNHKPFWTQDPIIITVKEKQPMSESIAQFAGDNDDGDKLAFNLVAGKPWASLSKEGLFTGTPQREDVGDNQYTVRVADLGGLTADVTVIIRVLHVNQPPYWTDNPVVLPNAKEKVAYSASLYDFAKDPDLNDTKRFVKLSGGPAWVRVSSDGIVSGTPQRADVGVNEFQVRVLDSENADAVTTVRITVEKVNQAPRWRQNPIQFGQIGENTTFTFNLADYAVDDDGDKLTFTKVDGPDWLFVGQDGIIKGTPMRKDIGPFTATFRVSDGQLNAVPDTKGIGEVIKKNQPPVINAAMPVFEVKERSVRIEDLTKWVSDGDGDKLNFEAEGSLDFVTLSADGQMRMEPKFKHIGDHTLKFKVNDAESAAHGEVKIRVIRDPRPPVWLTDPIRFEAKTNELFTNSVAGEARDLDGLRISFKKKSGPAWLSVDSEGGLKGTPKEADLGQQSWEVDACNDMLCATGHVIVVVKVGTQIDTIQVDTADPNARAEYTWIIDNSSWCDKTIRALKKYVNVFYERLSVIKHQGIYLSADAHKHDGTPIRVANGPALISSNNNPTMDFLKRLDGGISEDKCGNCYNSPIWSFFRFLQKASGISEIYHNGFFMQGVPSDAMMVSHQTDHYPFFTKNKPEVKDWTASDFAESYLNTYKAEGQVLRVSAMAPKCPKLISNNLHASAPENSYRTIVDATGGKYYATGCEFNMEQALIDYADRIIFRAYVHGKNKIKLSKQPIQVASSMKVYLGQTELKGNTGSEADLWYYDAATNTVNLRWWLIDQGQVKPGDKVRVEYRVS